MPSDVTTLAPDDVDRRLHPWSWLFAMVQQLKQFAWPLLVVIVTGRGNRFELFGLVGVAGIAVSSVAQYLTYRFRLGPDGIVISSGLFQRTRRDIPYDRVHNVVLHQALLHRVFGVAEVRLESAGGQKAEGHMRVLALADARALEQLIRSRGALTSQTLGAGDAEATTASTSTALLHLPTSEVLKLGLISNRGLVVVAAVLGALWQVLPNDRRPDDIVRWLYRLIVAESRALPDWLMGPVGIGLATTSALVMTIIALRLLSVVLAILQFHGFTLDDVGRQLRVERGLLTRVRLHLPRARIQAWRLTETLLHRWFNRQTLRVDTAGGMDASATRGMRDLAPLAPPAQISLIVHDALPNIQWPPTAWQPLHPRAWRRLIAVPGLIILVVTGVLVSQFGAWGSVLVAALPLVVARARLWARHAAYAEVAGGLIAMREGWLTKTWQFAETRKLQALRVTQSPFDRRHGMATLWLDTAGAGGRILHIPFLPVGDAHALHDRLAEAIES